MAKTLSELNADLQAIPEQEGLGKRILRAVNPRVAEGLFPSLSTQRDWAQQDMNAAAAVEQDRRAEAHLTLAQKAADINKAQEARNKTIFEAGMEDRATRLKLERRQRAAQYLQGTTEIAGAQVQEELQPVFVGRSGQPMTEKQWAYITKHPAGREAMTAFTGFGLALAAEEMRDREDVQDAFADFLKQQGGKLDRREGDGTYLILPLGGEVVEKRILDADGDVDAEDFLLMREAREQVLKGLIEPVAQSLDVWEAQQTVTGKAELAAAWNVISESSVPIEKALPMVRSVFANLSDSDKARFYGLALAEEAIEAGDVGDPKRLEAVADEFKPFEKQLSEMGYELFQGTGPTYAQIDSDEVGGVPMVRRVDNGSMQTLRAWHAENRAKWAPAWETPLAMLRKSVMAQDAGDVARRLAAAAAETEGRVSKTPAKLPANAKQVSERKAWVQLQPWYDTELAAFQKRAGYESGPIPPEVMVKFYNEMYAKYNPEAPKASGLGGVSLPVPATGAAAVNIIK